MPTLCNDTLGISFRHEVTVSWSPLGQEMACCIACSNLSVLKATLRFVSRLKSKQLESPCLPGTDINGYLLQICSQNQ
jgi:hypothetical protein